MSHPENPWRRRPLLRFLGKKHAPLPATASLISGHEHFHSLRRKHIHRQEPRTQGGSARFSEEYSLSPDLRALTNGLSRNTTGQSTLSLTDASKSAADRSSTGKRPRNSAYPAFQPRTAPTRFSGFPNAVANRTVKTGT